MTDRFTRQGPYFALWTFKSLATTEVQYMEKILEYFSQKNKKIKNATEERKMTWGWANYQGICILEMDLSFKVGQLDIISPVK